MNKQVYAPIHFHERIKNAVIAKDISYTDLAKITGISRRNLYEICEYGRVPNSMFLAKLCLVLNVSSDYVLGLTDIERIAGNENQKEVSRI